MMRYDVIDSAAWKSLTPAARSIYLQIARRFNGENNGYLAASVRDLALECNVAPNTVTASINQLISVALIDRTQEGSFTTKVRLAAEYRLACIKCNRTGREASNDFRRWRPAGPATLRAEKDSDCVQPSRAGSAA
ncbi:hypothetical protein AEYBE204_18720 [Asticcacaulis sp. YBE204]|nr:hypothetical protein AEYBE204_18720 [Asticcacaulis sp. YBE204]